MFVNLYAYLVGTMGIAAKGRARAEFSILKNVTELGTKINFPCIHLREMHEGSFSINNQDWLLHKVGDPETGCGYEIVRLGDGEANAERKVSVMIQIANWSEGIFHAELGDKKLTEAVPGESFFESNATPTHERVLETA